MSNLKNNKILDRIVVKFCSAIIDIYRDKQSIIILNYRKELQRI